MTIPDMVHRDLKLENILLATSDPKDAAVKVSNYTSEYGMLGLEQN